MLTHFVSISKKRTTKHKTLQQLQTPAKGVRSGDHSTQGRDARSRRVNLYFGGAAWLGLTWQQSMVVWLPLKMAEMPRTLAAF
jgi:hypothetical protein